MSVQEIALTEDVFEINRQVCSSLWNIAHVNETARGLSPRLILPQKRSGDIRISEQEARILYCGILNPLNYYYSVETPTKEMYQQTGQTPISASSDMSLYLENEERFDKVMNIEFKAHNPGQEQIRKHIEKLVRENIPGNWFHLLKNIDSRTIPVLFEKIKKSFLQCENSVKNTKVSIVFCFCVLEKSWACMKHFYYEPTKGNFQTDVNTFFNLKYSVKSGKIEMEQLHNWNIMSKFN